MPVVPSSFDATPVAFEVRGAGSPTIVFVPGLTGDRSDFAAQIAFFEQSNRVVAIDLPGAGQSGTQRSEWPMAGFGQDVATVVDHLGLGEIVLVGHSFGGDGIVEAGLRLKDRVRALVWVSSYRSLGSPHSEHQMEQWLSPFEDDYPAAMNDLTRRNFGPEADAALVDRIADRMMRSNPDVVVSVLKSKLRNESSTLVGIERINAPAFAINPDFKPNDRESFAAHDVDLRIIPGVGHYTMMENPVAFNATLAAILDELIPPS